MNIILETPRLFLRTFTTDDAELIYELNKDPQVTRYTFDPVTDLDHARKVLVESILPQYALYNHGRWAVHLKEDGAFMGWCGLKSRPERNEVDLGYRYKKEYWGRGFATEAAFACIRYGFTTLGLARITGRADAGNLASVKVLENCGMQYMGEDWVDGFPVRSYEICNPESV
jgi:[ribosomal protein S5]-alanine N-acetyltransferase